MFLSFIYIPVIFLDTPKEPVISKVAERKMSPTEDEEEESEKVTEKKEYIKVEVNAYPFLVLFYFLILKPFCFFAGNKNSRKIKVEERKIHK